MKGCVKTMAKKYYWLKLKEDFFVSKEMKKLRKIAGGDTFVIIYLKMQLLSIKEEGRLYFDGIEDDFASEIALSLDEDVENVEMTIAFLLKSGLLECVSDEEYLMTKVNEVTGSECNSAERVRRHRALQCNTKTLQCNSDVTKCNTEIEKEKDIEIEKRDRTDYQQIADMYNETCVSFPKCTALSDSRKKAIKARLKTYSANDFRKLFEKAEASSFLKGSNDRNWSANFDWLIKDGNMAKVLDGNYDGRSNLSNGQVEQPVINQYNAGMYEGVV